MPGQLLTNAMIATQNHQLDVISNGAIAMCEGMITWVGATEAVPAQFADWPKQDLEHKLVTPALIDCHTHLVFGGDRAPEFEMRLKGAGYEEIARAGGGINSTVAATRTADQNALVASALPRLDALIAEGVGTVEIKSGYGLTVASELAMLRAARALGQQRNVRIVTSFLGAHAVPAEYTGQPDDYIEQVCLPALRAAHAEGLVDAVDGFCESIAFSAEQIARVFDLAAELGIPVKLHAEQLSHSGGCKLAARYGALSVDHIEYATNADTVALARSGTVAVLLPGAFYTLRETQLPPISELREHGVPMALATDCNPGSSPLTSLLLVMNMACTLFRLTPDEALAGVTRNAARALGLKDIGVIKTGMRAELAIWDVNSVAELSYRIGFNPLYTRIIGGLECPT
ncbi:MAG: imidazolonepropionase [Paracoccaceae bacterium]